MVDINFAKIEKKWQSRWEKDKAFEVSDKSKKEKFYCLEMFPYPSATGLHMGHAFNYTIGDILARYKRMKGFNVLYPMGFDSLGLPAENAAIKAKSHPKKFTEVAIKNYIFQMKGLGLSYDWSRILETHNPEFYKWDQWIFLKMLEKGIAYRKKAPVNWCSACNTVLANEQVVNGCCWRHSDVEVQIKQLEQWFIKTTKYADELLDKLDSLDWPERIKIMQKNWIGKSHGSEIVFRINGDPWIIFTTRPDTVYGVTFMVVSAQHPKLMDLVKDKQKKDVETFLKKIKTTSEKDADKLNKEGVFTGSYAEHPFTKEKIPVYAGNFVLADYGSGMVMAVPAHDQRDYDFARKYKIPVKLVIQPEDESISGKGMREAYTGYGILVNSGPFNGLQSREAKEHITNALQLKKIGKRTVNYKLRDWLVSRQRYWGTPIPVIYCDACGIVPVPEKDLPVKLPDKVEFGKGNPLKTNKNFVDVKCPKCSGKGRRETDTMDTFANSSWYYLRYADPKNTKEIFDSKKVKYWMPVDQYIGGAEHAVMHLIYARFYTKFLRDLGLIDIDEPFKRLFNQGMLHGNDGDKMSKSKGNVILPEEVSKNYGIDTARFFLMSIASPDKDLEWSDSGIKGSSKFINQVVSYFDSVKIVRKNDKKIESKLNKTIDLVTKDIENFKYNLATIKIRQLFSSFSDENTKKVLEDFLKLLSVFCPHISEELYEKLGNKKLISLSDWPEAGKVDESLIRAEESLDKTIDDINYIINLIKEKEGKDISKVFIYVMPNELINYDVNVLNKRFNKEVKVFSVSDKAKYDPEGKSRKAKPGKPGIYVE